ncbi:MAG: class I SAM-dependent methyltransferase [Planctomycetes bacterium]|nr:class I SAM-dependent methyltransferase [Planctomycetota bacterium]
MNHLLRGVARAISEAFELPGPILEIGSYQVAGHWAANDLRPFFPNQKYIGLDSRAGPGVDRVGNVEELPFEDGSVGTVVSLSAFEHVKRFWRGFEEVHRVLRPDGAFVVACPFFFRIHHFPDDYWRFTPSALKALLERYPSKILGWHGPRHRPANVWALAFRERRPAITEAQFASYQALLNEYAREPLSWHRCVRYAVARLLCGRGPFASYLERNRVETICQNSTAPSLLRAQTLAS